MQDVTPAAAVAAPATPGADLAAAAVAAFAQTPAAVANQAAAAITPASAPVAAAAPAAAAKLPNTLLSETPADVVPAAKTAAAVAAEAAKPAAAPEYALAIPESGRLTKDQVSGIEAFAKSHGMTEAQAKQVLAREDLNVANAFDQARDQLIADPVLGGAKIDQTIATTKQVLGAFFSPEDRKLIASMPIANSRLLHSFCAKVAALIPQEDVSRLGGNPAPSSTPQSLGQAMYPHLYSK